MDLTSLGEELLERKEQLTAQLEAK
jgi:hypothetical protein